MERIVSHVTLSQVVKCVYQIQLVQKVNGYCIHHHPVHFRLLLLNNVNNVMILLHVINVQVQIHHFAVLSNAIMGFIQLIAVSIFEF